MKYNFISMASCCLILLANNLCRAQKDMVDAKTFLALLDSSKAKAQRENKHTKIKETRELRHEPLDEFYRISDSLNLVKPKALFSDSLVNELKQKDKDLPYKFLFAGRNAYITNPEKLDDIAVLMFVGLMRYDYYLAVIPSYAPNGEGWVYTQSFKQNEKLKIELHLQNNIEKYKAILRFAINYCTNNEYKFYSKPRETLMFNKVMQPYKNLLNELESNSINLVNKWSKAKASSLATLNLKKDSIERVKEKKDADSVMNETYRLTQLTIICDSLWKKIELERKKTDSTVLRQLVLQFLHEKKECETIVANIFSRKEKEQKMKLEDANTLKDTTKIFVRKAIHEAELQNARSKQEVFNYYDALKGVNTWNYRISKLNNVLLEYINQYSWNETTKVEVFNVVKYTDDYFDDGYDKTKDLYLTKAEILQREIRLQNWLSTPKKNIQQANTLMQILGEVVGTLVSEDVYAITDKYLKEPIENLK